MFKTADRAYVEVQDVFTFAPDGSANLRRRYRFLNDGASQVTLSWEGVDRVPANGSRVTIEGDRTIELGLTEDEPPRFLWEVRDLQVGPGESSDVHLVMEVPNLLQAAPLRLQISYEARALVSYAFRLIPFFQSLFSAERRSLSLAPPFDVSDLTTSEEGHIISAASFHVSANRTGELRLALSKTEPQIKSTRLMSYYTRRARDQNKSFEDRVAIIIPHLLADSLSYFSALKASGLRPEHAFIVGIPYSWKEPVATSLWEQGFRSIALPSSYPFDNQVEQQLLEALELCTREDMRLVILEDGGYAGPLLHQNYAESLSLCDGIVEQTRNGIWQYREKDVEIAVPLINVAECSLKLEKESPLVGEAVVFNIRRLLGDSGWTLRNYRALVVGYGSTGREIARALRAHGIDVAVYDQTIDRLAAAAEEGLVTGTSLGELLGGRQLIIGSTGAEPFQFPELTRIEHNAIFVNASSKRRELNYKELEYLTKPNTKWERVAGALTRIELVNDKYLNLLADGYPVNFVGESVPDEEISFIVGLLYRSAVYLVEERLSLAAGLCDVPAELMEEVQERFEGLVRAQ